MQVSSVSLLPALALVLVLAVLVPGSVGAGGGDGAQYEKSLAGSGVAKVLIKHRQGELLVAIEADAADGVHGATIRWNPTGGTWRQIRAEGEEALGAERTRFYGVLRVGPDGPCLIEVILKRDRGVARSPSFDIDTKTIGGGTVTREFSLASDGLLSGDVWLPAQSGEVGIAVRPHGEDLRINIATNHGDGVREVVVRWNPTGGGWLVGKAKVLLPEGGLSRFALSLDIPRDGPCLLEIVVKRRDGGPKTSPQYTIDTAKLGKRGQTMVFALSARAAFGR